MRRCYQWDNIDKKVDIWIRKTKEDTNLIGPVRYPHTYNDLVKSNLELVFSNPHMFGESTGQVHYCCGYEIRPKVFFLRQACADQYRSTPLCRPRLPSKAYICCKVQVQGRPIDPRTRPWTEVGYKCVQMCGLSTAALFPSDVF
ncbi:hypothetical protein LSAT2_001872 [Lamellibrachia satsuma]|nr:hypothetical protein LSAT2_001872 [Lamellibrachia satsuma]